MDCLTAARRVSSAVNAPLNQRREQRHDLDREEFPMTFLIMQPGKVVRLNYLSIDVDHDAGESSEAGSKMRSGFDSDIFDLLAFDPQFVRERGARWLLMGSHHDDGHAVLMFEQFDIRPIINAVGYATRVSGSCPHPDHGFDDHGAPLDAMLEARERGVLFDVGHGVGAFVWSVAEPACQKSGFWPDHDQH